MARITRPVSSRRRDRPVLVSESELLRFFATLGQQSEVAQLFYLCCILIRARCTDLQHFAWEHYDAAAGTWRAHALPPALIARLNAMRTSASIGPVFTVQHGPISWHPNWAHLHVGQICRQADLASVTLHDVRHTWPTLTENTQHRLLQAMDDVAARQRGAFQPPVVHRTVRVVPYQPQQKKVVPVRSRPAAVIRRLRPVAPLPPEWPG